MDISSKIIICHKDINKDSWRLNPLISDKTVSINWSRDWTRFVSTSDFKASLSRSARRPHLSLSDRSKLSLANFLNQLWHLFTFNTYPYTIQIFFVATIALKPERKRIQWPKWSSDTWWSAIFVLFNADMFCWYKNKIKVKCCNIAQLNKFVLVKILN